MSRNDSENGESTTQTEDERLQADHPELFSCTNRELEIKARNTLYELENQLRAMKIRGDGPTWWSPAELLEEIDWITEDYGWEGVGR